MLLFLLAEILVLIAVTLSFVSPIFPHICQYSYTTFYGPQKPVKSECLGYLLLSKTEIQCSYALVSQPPV